MSLNRREFLEKGVEIAALGALLPNTLLKTGKRRKTVNKAFDSSNRESLLVSQDTPADVNITIDSVLAEISDKHVVSTVGYNGQVPGPVIHLKEGKQVTVALTNNTDVPEFAHWHGQMIPAAVDGAPAEKSLVIPPHDELHYRFTPRPSGSRWLHTHVMAGNDLHKGTYTGEFAFVYIQPADEPGDYEKEFFLTTHEWGGYFNHEEMAGLAGVGEEEEEEGEEGANGWEVAYSVMSVNGKALGHGEPLRVKEGQRVLFHFLNANATSNTQLSLPGHKFKIIALDGNPVPNPQTVETLWLGVAERIDAIVEMNNPGVWILGSPVDEFRNKGLGAVVEYANRKGEPKWQKPKDLSWNYTYFGKSDEVQKPDEIIPMVIKKRSAAKNGFNVWTINGKSFEEQKSPKKLQQGKRYRLAFDNQSDDWHPLHLHRNTFELTKVYGKSTSGVMKDVVLIKPDGKIDVDFSADRPGLTLFHCHQKLHMDFGFMKLFDVV
jgi:FtsP/CotA-like multicopper oxidase with cupredoxin domain